MKPFAVLAMLICASAQGATGLAVIDVSGAKAGDLVTTTAGKYGTPKDGDLVRVGAGWPFTWTAWPLANGAKYDACLGDVDEGTLLPLRWTAAGDACKAHGTLTAVGPIYEATATPGTFALSKGATQKSTGHASQDICVAAARSDAVAAKAAGNYECKTTTAVAVKVVAPPVIPPATGASVKWHPGHYLRPSEQAFASKDAARFAGYDLLKDDSRYQGGLQTTPWGVIETAKGVYDFTQVDKDLAYLKAMGKRFIVEIWWMNYWHDFRTRARGGGYVPDYLIDNGCAVASTGYNGVGYTVELHRPECMDRLIALFDALAKRYDNEPMFEQIIITEPSTPYAAWKPDPFLEQFKRLVAATGKAWTHTPVVFYMNWFTHAKEMAAATAAAGVGIGGPDILPPQPLTEWGEDDGSFALRGAGNVTKYYNGSPYVTDYGTVDYRGKIPVSYSYEAADAGRNLSPSKLMPYALDTLKSTHIAWTIAGHLSSEMNYSTGVLPALKAANFRINTACPTIYAGRCAQ